MKNKTTITIVGIIAATLIIMVALIVGGLEEEPATPALPSPTLAPTPSPAAVTEAPPNDLATTHDPDLWVDITQDSLFPAFLAVFADPAFDVELFDLSVFVDGIEYCNDSDYYADAGRYQMDCQLEDKSHKQVQNVSAQVYEGKGLRCERHRWSDSDGTIFACEWRDR